MFLIQVFVLCWVIVALLSSFVSYVSRSFGNNHHETKTRFFTNTKTNIANHTMKSNMTKESNINRFMRAQEPDYATALSEIKNGRKRSHWMWYIFPQIQGLGFSETSKYYGIKDMNEAEEYLKHPILGNRLIEICDELLKLQSNDANSIFGSPDDLKLKSSMTLFSSLKINPVFQLVLNKFFNGAKDTETLRIIEKEE